MNKYQQFLTVYQDQDQVKAFADMDLQGVLQVFHDKGIDLTAEEFKSYIEKAQKGIVELDDDDLDEVVGGSSYFIDQAIHLIVKKLWSEILSRFF